MKKALYSLAVCSLVTAVCACSSDANIDCVVNELKCEEGMLYRCTVDEIWPSEGVVCESGICENAVKCQDPVVSCTPGEKFCKENVHHACNAAGDTWIRIDCCVDSSICVANKACVQCVDVEDCPIGSLECRDNRCISKDVVCTDGMSQCFEGMLQTCVDGIWSEGLTCDKGQECLDGASVCTDAHFACTDGMSQCFEGMLQTCVDGIWSEGLTCDKGQECLDGASVCTVVNRVNVMEHGAIGDGLTDDTAAIQAAIDEVAGTGGTVWVPDGIYLVDAVTSIRLKSEMTLHMSAGAVLKAKPNAATHYAIVRIESASNVTMIGGTVMGERDEHMGTDGEWGMGVWIGNSHDVLIDGVTARDCWGDGFYQHGGTPQSTKITLSGVVADNNRRQGLSIENVDGMLIEDSVFKNTGGKAPEAGIDIEPYTLEQAAENIIIKNSQFLNNQTSGIALNGHAGPINNVTMEGNSVAGNGGGIGVMNTSGHHIIQNTIADIDCAIWLNNTSGNTITNNIMSAPNPMAGNGAPNASTGDDGGNTVSGNICNGKPC